MLKNLQSQLQKLELDLQDPGVFNDPKKLKEVSRKHKEVKEKIGIIKEIEETNKDIKNAKEMMESKDEELVKIAQEELEELENKKKRLEKELKEIDSPDAVLNKKNIIMEIRAGVGGDEAELFAEDLFQMYSRFAEKKGWKTSLLSSQTTGIGGLKEVIFEIKGERVYEHLKKEIGTHRVQRIPKTEKAGRIHTSAATVAVLPEAEEVDFKINPNDLRIDTYRSSGAGGQHVNKTSSAVRVTHLPTNLMVACQDGRSQHQNREKALMVLRSRLLAQEQKKVRINRIEERRTQVGTGDRSEKIRTYNFPQDRVTDHRIKKSWHNIDQIIEGGLDEIVESLV